MTPALQRGACAIVDVANPTWAKLPRREAVRQLGGEAGRRQVARCETAIAHGNGGTLSAQSTVILSTEATA